MKAWQPDCQVFPPVGGYSRGLYIRDTGRQSSAGPMRGTEKHYTEGHGEIPIIDALESDYRHVIAASASGGVFKSVNAGTTWEPIFDRYGTAAIGDVALCQKNPDIIWVGTGEPCVRNSVGWGDGVYKSTGILTDHWFKFHSGDGFHVQVDPTDWTTVYTESQGGAIRRNHAVFRQNSVAIRPNPENVTNFLADWAARLLPLPSLIAGRD